MNCKFRVLAMLTLAALALPSAALATNGYFPHGQGTRTKGMAGAGVAFPQDSIATATNPAGMALVGTRYDVGVDLFNPIRDYSYSGPSPFIANASQDSETDFFLIPHFGINWDIGGDQTLGGAVYAHGGMNTDYPLPVFGGGSGHTGVDLAQLFFALTYAVDLGRIQLGVSGILAYQQFSAEGLQPFDNAFFSSNPGSVTNNGSDTSTGFGVRVGAIVDVGGGFRVGGSYQPEIDMGEFDKYSGLFAEKGDFNIPSTYTVGAALELGETVTVALDFMTINYSDVPAVHNPGETNIGLGPAPVAGSRLGEDNGLGFGWEDIDIIKLGVAWKANDDWTLRAGFNHGDNPIPSNQTFFNILAPGVMEDHITAGFTVAMGESSEFSAAFMHALENTVTGQFPAFIGGGTNNITMSQNEMEISFSNKF